MPSNHSSDIDFKDLMKLYKNYTKISYSLFSERYIFTLDKSIKIQEKLIIKMSVSGKTKVINNKIEQNKAQYDLDREKI